VLGEIRAASAIVGDAARYAFHPALLDACLQCFGALIADAPADRDALFIPIAIDRVALTGAPAPELVSHVRMRHDDRAKSGTLVCDALVARADGHVVLRAEGMRLRVVDRAAKPRARDLFWSVQWVERPIVAPSSRAAETWRIVNDGARDLGDRVATALRAAGDAIADEASSIVYVTAPTSEREAIDACARIASLLKGGAKRLCVVTCGAHDSPFVAAPWALLGSVAAEHPDVACTRIDVSSPSDDELSALAREIHGGHDDPQVRLRTGKRYVARLAAAPRKRAEVEVRGDATYLVSGGFGALGLALARTLAVRGARSLLLLGRRSPDASALAAIEELARTGVTVTAHVVDVGDRFAVARVVEEASHALPPIRGVVHAAGTLDDALATELSAERFERVLAPKLAGALALDAACENHPLDFFALFSSVASLFGAPGQGNYAAANAALDALAVSRRAAGRPFVSMQWGPWAEIGMAARTQARASGARALAALSPDEACAAFFDALALDTPVVAIARLDAEALSARAPWQRSLFELLVPAKAASSAPSLSILVAEAAAPRRFALVDGHVRSRVAAILGMPSDRLDGAQPFRELGFDSLMAVELRNALVADTGRPLPATLLFDHPTSDALTAFLARELGATSEPATTLARESVDDAADARRARAIDRLARASEEEAEALLFDRLKAAEQRGRA
jgi:myxalamid-type polyketide synthase MxaE and MxaD